MLLQYSSVMSLCDLPSEILSEICTHLGSVDDVLALQSAHPALTKKLNQSFWRIPKCLYLSADQHNEPHLLIGEFKQLKFRKPSWARLQAILRKSRNLKELVIGDCGKHFTAEEILQTLCYLQENNDIIQLRSIVAYYQNPESFCQQNNGAWPSRKTHDKLCELVKGSGPSLLTLSVGINNSDEFVSIRRNFIRDAKIQIQYCHESSWNSRLQIFYPLLSGFAAAAAACRPTKTLDIQMKMSPSLANIILDFCVQICVPSHSKSSRLENITVTFTAMNEKPGAKAKEFTNFVNTRNLKSLVWFFDVSLPEDKVETLCCPVGDCPYDIFVQTPDMKKIYPGMAPTVCLTSPKLLRCIS